MSETIGPIVKLTKSDARDDFSCGEESLDIWFEKFSWTSQRSNNATTYVCHSSQKVVGYYAITVAGVARDVAPDAIGKHGPTQVPCILLARLAVDLEYHGRGIGSQLLADSLVRAAMLSETVGVRSFLIHAQDVEARNFYLSQAEFEPSPTDDLHLFMKISDIKKNLD